MVGRADRIAVALRQLVDRLLLAGGHERVQARLAVALALAGRTVAQPHAVMQVDDVDARDRAAALAVGLGVVEVRRDPDHERRLASGFGTSLVSSEDQVRAGRDRIRARGEVQVLDAVGGERRRGERKHGRHTDHCADDCSSQVRSSVRLRRLSLRPGIESRFTDARGAKLRACRRAAVPAGSGGLPGLGVPAVRTADRRRDLLLEHEAALTAVDGSVLGGSAVARAGAGRGWSLGRDPSTLLGQRLVYAGGTLNVSASPTPSAKPAVGVSPL